MNYKEKWHTREPDEADIAMIGQVGVLGLRDYSSRHRNRIAKPDVPQDHLMIPDHDSSDGMRRSSLFRTMLLV